MKGLVGIVRREIALTTSLYCLKEARRFTRSNALLNPSRRDEVQKLPHREAG